MAPPGTGAGVGLAVVLGHGSGPTPLKASTVLWTPGSRSGFPSDVLAFDGTSFVAVAASASGLSLLRFDGSGDELGPTVDVAQPPSSRLRDDRLVAGSNAIAIDGGVAVAWLDVTNGVAAHASLVRPDGTMAHDEVLAAGVFDARTGNGPFASIAVRGGDVFAVSGTGRGEDPVRVSELGWAGGAPSTTVVAGSSGNSRAWPLLASGGRLLFANDQGGITELFAGAPGGSFAPIWQLPDTPVAQAVDGCGRYVALSYEDDPSSGPQLVAHTLKDATPPVVLGNLFTSLAKPFVMPVIVGTPGGFDILWEDGTRSLQFARLSWR